jgi:opacity protein-like surface antigen
MQKRNIAVAVIGLSAFIAHPGRAQFGGGGEPMVRIGFGGGMSVPTSHTADALKTGVNGQGYLLVNLVGIPLRFNLGYQRFDYKDALLAANGATSGSSQQVSGIAGLALNLFSIGPLRPYVTAGVGGFNLKNELETSAGTTSTSKMEFGVDGGAGLRLKLGRLEAFAEGRVQNVYTDKGVIDTKSITSIPVTFGILF